MTKEVNQTVTNEDALAAAQQALAEAVANVAAAAASTGTSTGNVQADAGVAGRYAGSGVDFGNDTGQAESWTNLNLRRAENQEAHDQALRALEVQAVANAQVIANRQNQGGEATTQRINAIQENQLMFDNDWLVALGIRTPVFLDAVATKVVDILNKKEE